MSEYLIALGHNVPLEDLVAFDPQPAIVGYRYTRRSIAVSGAVEDEAPFLELVFELLDPESMYQSVLTQSGLLVAKTALVTVYVEDENYDWIRKNGTAVKPMIGSDGGRTGLFLQNFVILVKKLQTVAS